MGVAEWNALAWWEQRLLREGLSEEFRDPESSPDAPSGGSPDRTLMNNQPGELAAVGIKEQTL